MDRSPALTSPAGPRGDRRGTPAAPAGEWWREETGKGGAGCACGGRRGEGRLRSRGSGGGVHGMGGDGDGEEEKQRRVRRRGRWAAHDREQTPGVTHARGARNARGAPSTTPTHVPPATCC